MPGRRLPNPPANALPPGFDAKSLVEAVTKTGGPLQAWTAARFLFELPQLVSKGPVAVVEEWSYRDSEADTLRAMDIMAVASTWDEPQPHVRPGLALLVECKRSDRVFLFYESASPLWPMTVPLICGAPHEDLTFVPAARTSTYTEPLPRALGLTTLPFMSQPPAIASTFTSAGHGAGRGRPDFTDETIYREIVLALVKATKYFRSVTNPTESTLYFDAYVTIPLCVLDAPMFVVEPDKDSLSLSLQPWVRISRQEAGDAHPFWAAQLDHFLIDVVHREFLSTYLEEHLFPFWRVYHDVTLSHQKEIIDGVAHLAEEAIRSPQRPGPMRPVNVRERAWAKIALSGIERSRTGRSQRQ